MHSPRYRLPAREEKDVRKDFIVRHRKMSLDLSVFTLPEYAASNGLLHLFGLDIFKFINSYTCLLVQLAVCRLKLRARLRLSEEDGSGWPQ